MANTGEIETGRPDSLELAAASRPLHIVDQLIAERGEKLVASRAWPLVKPLLYRVLHYAEAVRMADTLAPLDAQAAMDYIGALLDLRLEIEGAGHIPRAGAFILAANHPTGIADGVAVYDALKPVRPDISIFTNRDAARVNPRLTEILIPVEWREDLRSRDKTKETLRLSSRAFAEGRAIVMFPSGRIAFWKDGRLNERPWQPSIVTLARKHRVPVLPVHVDARNSWLFYWFANWNTELRDMTVFHELLNKRGKTFRITFGRPIPTERLEGDPAAVTTRLQRHCVERLAQDPDAEF